MPLSNADAPAQTRTTFSSENTSPSGQPEGEILLAWLHLANLPLTPRLMNTLLAHFDDDPRRIFAAPDTAFDEVAGFQARHLVRLRDPLLLPSDRQLAWLEKHDVWLALRGRPEYPLELEVLTDPPPILFVRGTLLPTDGRSIGVVGSRHATPYGRATSERLARELAEQEVTVVSGGAVGIDASAHRGALSGGGRTLAFLGCGLDVDYPRENRLLFEQILGQGALISENPLGAQPEAWRFPARNRLIAAMSLAVLVVEAPKQSGALITARYAADQGRMVLAVPGNIDRPSSVGCNELLKEGAILITETADVLEAVNLLPRTSGQGFSQGVLDLRERRAALEAASDTSEPEPSESTTLYRTAAPKSASKSPAPAPPDSSAILRSFSPIRRSLMEALTQTPQHLDLIARLAEVSSTDAGIELIYLELDGYVRRLPGNTYIRTLA